MKGLLLPSYEGSSFKWKGSDGKPVKKMLDVTFSFMHDCFYCNLSREFPEATMIVACNDQRDIVEFISSSQRSVETAIKKLRETGTEVERSEKGNRVVVVTEKCLCNICGDSETPIPTDLGVLLLSPRVFSNGWEQRRILGFDNGHVRSIMKSLQDNFPTKIISKKPVQGGLVGELFCPSSNQLFGSMTQKQMEAIQLATEHGYYTMPRKVTTAKLAKAFGTSRPTFEEHLRKAENKVVKIVCNYIGIEQ
jgi:hypothetical protein